MWEFFKEYILPLIVTISSALATWLATALTNSLNKKAKDKRNAELQTRTFNIITDAVKQTYQEFVETLKENEKFDEDAQKEAKERTIALIKSQLTTELQEFIADNFGEVDPWINNKIEAVLYDLKVEKKKKEN